MLLEDLKTKTEPHHRKIEEQIHLFQRVKSISDHVDLLAGYYGFLLPLEQDLAQIPELNLYFDFKNRQKIALIEKDFKYFHMTPDAKSKIAKWNCAEFCRPLTLSKAVGILYVLEGSTLGGKFITQHLKTELGLADEAGLSYYSSYGPRLGQMWQTFRGAVEILETEGKLNAAECTEAAIATFEALGHWLEEKR